MRPGNLYILLGGATLLLVGIFVFSSRRGSDADSSLFSVFGTNTASIVVPGGSRFGLGEPEATQRKAPEALDIPKEVRPRTP